MVIETVFRQKAKVVFVFRSRSRSAPTRDPPRSRQGRFASGNNNGERAASGGARRVGCHEKSRAGDERLRRVRGPTGARRGRRPARTSRAPRRDDPRDRPLVDGSSDSVFKKPRARHISSVELRASLATLDAPAAATPFAASAPLFRACFGTSWGVRRELRGGNTRALPRVRASERSDDKKKNRGSSRGARLGHQLSELADLAKNNEREPNRA
jgi:hypothetical protein